MTFIPTNTLIVRRYEPPLFPHIEKVKSPLYEFGPVTPTPIPRRPSAMCFLDFDFGKDR